MYIDAPYGTKSQGYDKAFSKDDLNGLAQLLKATITLGTSTAFVVWCHYLHISMFNTFLTCKTTGMGCTNVVPIYSYTQNQTVHSQVGKLVPSMQCGLLAFYPSAREYTDCDLPVSPLGNHNLGFTQRPVRATKLNGEVLNVGENSVLMAKWIADRFSTETSNILILCAGTGSDLIPFIDRGADVTAVEVVEEQYDYMVGRVRAFKEMSDDEKKRVFNRHAAPKTTCMHDFFIKPLVDPALKQVNDDAVTIHDLEADVKRLEKEIEKKDSAINKLRRNVQRLVSQRAKEKANAGKSDGDENSKGQGCYFFT